MAVAAWGTHLWDPTQDAVAAWIAVEFVLPAVGLWVWERRLRARFLKAEE